jgi:hypothetical protein
VGATDNAVALSLYDGFRYDNFQMVGLKDGQPLTDSSSLAEGFNSSYGRSITSADMIYWISESDDNPFIGAKITDSDWSEAWTGTLPADFEKEYDTDLPYMMGVDGKYLVLNDASSGLYWIAKP